MSSPRPYAAHQLSLHPGTLPAITVSGSLACMSAPANGYGLAAGAQSNVHILDPANLAGEGAHAPGIYTCGRLRWAGDLAQRLWRSAVDINCVPCRSSGEKSSGTASQLGGGAVVGRLSAQCFACPLCERLLGCISRLCDQLLCLRGSSEQLGLSHRRAPTS